MDRLKKLISCLAVVCLTLALLAGLTKLTEKKDSYAKHGEYFEQAADFDVLFFGSSHMMNGVLSMELWKSGGIVSYNFGEAGHTLPAEYWVMRNLFEQRVPKLAVIDCYALDYNEKTSFNYSLMHTSMDSFPLTRVKLEANADILDDPYMDYALDEGEKRGPINLIWNYSVFHSRWNQLEQRDFVPEKSYLRGTVLNSAVVPAEFVRDPSGKVWEGGSVGEDYLRRMIELCSSRGVDVLLTFLPYGAGEKDQSVAAYVPRLAEEYGINYINFLELDTVDYRVDIADTNTHLNDSGAKKVSALLGEYIAANYAVPDRRSDPAYASWDADLALYEQGCEARLRDSADIYSALMLLYGTGLDATLTVRDPDLYSDPTVRALLENLGLEPAGEQLVLGSGSPSASADENAGLTIAVSRAGQPVFEKNYYFAFDSLSSRLRRLEEE